MTGPRMVVNYGTNRVRFPSPVPVGARVRGVTELISLGDVDGGAQAVFRITVECDAGPKPACVADMVVRYYR